MQTAFYICLAVMALCLLGVLIYALWQQEAAPNVRYLRKRDMAKLARLRRAAQVQDFVNGKGF